MLKSRSRVNIPFISSLTHSRFEGLSKQPENRFPPMPKKRPEVKYLNEIYFLDEKKRSAGRAPHRSEEHIYSIL